jgi:hypothetical protein
MEYNLLKTIETNYGFISEEEIIMTPYPSDIQIIPGIGQIINNLSIVTTLHHNVDATISTKKSVFDSSENNQLGAGNSEQEIEDNENDTKDNTVSENSTQIAFNEQKRKAMGDEVYESFMHPKMFKTNSVTLNNQKEKVNTPTKLAKTVVQKSKELSNSKTKLKHKFNVSD